MLINLISASQHGVVCFRGRENFTDDLQKRLCQQLSELAGKPADSTIHIHPLCNKGEDISGISNNLNTNIFTDRRAGDLKITISVRNGWNSDVGCDPILSDYAVLKLTTLPTQGGGK